MRKAVGGALLLLALNALPALSAEKRWVVSEGTALKAEQSVSAASVTELPVGAELTLVEGAGRWLKVQTSDGKEGWVYAGRVSDTAPVAEVGGGEGLFGDSLQKSQITTAKADSARSIRGLSPEVAQYAKQRGTPENLKKELDRILSRKVSDKDIKAFLKEGKIGEYAQ